MSSCTPAIGMYTASSNARSRRAADGDPIGGKLTSASCCPACPPSGATIRGSVGEPSPAAAHLSRLPHVRPRPVAERVEVEAPPPLALTNPASSRRRDERADGRHAPRARRSAASTSLWWAPRRSRSSRAPPPCARGVARLRQRVERPPAGGAQRARRRRRAAGPPAALRRWRRAAAPARVEVEGPHRRSSARPPGAAGAPSPRPAVAGGRCTAAARRVASQFGPDFSLAAGGTLAPALSASSRKDGAR